MGRISDLDRRLFDGIAGARFTGAETVLPRLTRAANHGRLWFGTAAALAAGGPTARRSALRGLGALAAASLTANTVVKYATRRQRPQPDTVPLIRRLPRLPHTTSFPSGHAASAAAFATGVALESPRHAALVAPLAAAVALSRVYVGVHYPGDVLAGVAVGVGAAMLTRRWWPELPRPSALVRERTTAPALSDGTGLVVVVNTSAGSGTPAALSASVQRLSALLPGAEIIARTEEEDLGRLLDDAARRAAGRKGALGVCGGDGSVNAAAERAAEHGLALAVFSGGTLNHFALDVGVPAFEDTARAVTAGEAVRVDLARGRPGGDREAAFHFLNTFSIGLYPELVRARERLEGRIGRWPAAAVSLATVLHTAQPCEVTVNGRPRRLWMLFAGNGLYSPGGFAPVHRTQLDDGLLDIRIIDGSQPLARTRVITSALTGTLSRSRVYTSVRLPRVRLAGLRPNGSVAYDGEAAPAPDTLVIDKRRVALTIYSPDSDQAELARRPSTLVATRGHRWSPG